MSECPIGLVECKYPRSCFKTCNVCIRWQKRDELESMLLEIERKSYNQALEDLNNALLSDKYISKFYGVCEKIVEILARLYK